MIHAFFKEILSYLVKCIRLFPGNEQSILLSCTYKYIDRYVYVRVRVYTLHLSLREMQVLRKTIRLKPHIIVNYLKVKKREQCGTRGKKGQERKKENEI